MAKILIIDADAQSRSSALQAMIPRRDAVNQPESAGQAFAQIPISEFDVMLINSKESGIQQEDLLSAIKSKYPQADFMALTIPSEARVIAPEPACQPANRESSIKLPSDGISLEAVEKNFILQALEVSGNNKTRAAKLLGISRRAMYSKMLTHAIVDAKAKDKG